MRPMPNRRRVLGPPREYLASGIWPRGRIAKGAPPAVAYAKEISKRLDAALAGRSQSMVAEQADLARSTLHDIISGRSWPDIVTLAKLERLLGVRLWPD